MINCSWKNIQVIHIFHQYKCIDQQWNAGKRSFGIQQTWTWNWGVTWKGLNNDKLQYFLEWLSIVRWNPSAYWKNEVRVCGSPWVSVDLRQNNSVCHFPSTASLMASTYCAGTQYTQYLEASVGPSWIPWNQKHQDYS
jgi:hypothetical protein